MHPSYHLSPLVAALFAAVLPLPSLAAPAHVHGQAQLEVTLEGSELEIRLDSPADNLLGFEHVPRTAAEKAALAALPAQLTSAQFSFPASAGCVAGKVEMKSSLLDASDDKDHDHGHGHADFEATFHWTCAHPEALTSISTQLFATFPHLHTLNAAFVSAKAQKAATLTAQQPTFSLR